MKWEHYSNDYNTWEPESRLLEDVAEIVFDFNDMYEDQQSFLQQKMNILEDIIPQEIDLNQKVEEAT